MKYTIKDFKKQFPDDQTCLDYLLNARFGGKKAVCPNCRKIANYSHITGRKTYACAWCAKTVSPTAHTIFHKSETPLTLWFHAIFLMSQSRNGVAATEIVRHIGVTYKTAFRMMHKIRELMKEGKSIFEGTSEMDETYIGGVAKGHRGRGAAHKTAVFGISNRDTGKVFAQAVDDVKLKTLAPLIRERVKIGSKVMTDTMTSYYKSEAMGYKHQKVNHSAGEYVHGEVHTNSIEGFWSNLKRGLDGTHHSVSPKYLQKYLDEFVFRWNHRGSDVHLFDLLLARIATV